MMIKLIAFLFAIIILCYPLGSVFACDVTVSNSDELKAAISDPTNTGKEICLQHGIYLPDATDRNASFNIAVDNITLKGLGSRSLIVLSGNIGDPAIQTDNSEHVVTILQKKGIALKNLSVLDGSNDQSRTLTGDGKGWGAGILAVGSDLLLDNVLVANNTLTGTNGSGAALGLLNSTVSIQNSKIGDNVASGFAAVYIRDLGLGGTTSLDIKNSDFLNNEGKINSGGIFAAFASSVNIDNSRFLGNKARACCGGVRIDVSG